MDTEHNEKSSAIEKNLFRVPCERSGQLSENRGDD